jgi:hypothetical protein
MSAADKIRFALDALASTAPECREPQIRALLQHVHGLLQENGWTVDGVMIDLPKGVTADEAQAAVAALANPPAPTNHVGLIPHYRKTIWDALEGCFTLIGTPDAETFQRLVVKVLVLVEAAARTTMHPDLIASGGRDIEMYRESLAAMTKAKERE